MRWHPALVIALITAGCVTTTRSADSVPSDLAVTRNWQSNPDGYIFTVGYFTREQIDSSSWEAARVDSAATARLCYPDSKEIVRRDVRWFEPIASGEPRCAAVVYSFACTPRRTERSSQMDYGRRQAMLEGLAAPIETNCGEKDGSRILPVRIPDPSGVSFGQRELCRDLKPDYVVGAFELRDVNYVQERTQVSGDYIKRGQPLSASPANFLGQAAVAGQKLHFIISPRDLPHDRYNILIDQTFTLNGEGYCITFTAKQGNSLWRRTIKRDTIPTYNARMVERSRHSKNPATYWDQFTDEHLLSHLFARHIGLDLPSDHSTDVTIGDPAILSSEGEIDPVLNATPRRRPD